MKFRRPAAGRCRFRAIFRRSANSRSTSSTTATPNGRWRREHGGHALVAGENYGLGSSREHAALAPRYLGLRVELAKSFARIHWQNLTNSGVLPVTFETADDCEKLDQGDALSFSDIHESLRRGDSVAVEIRDKSMKMTLRHKLSERQVDLLLAGGVINWLRQKEDRS